MKQGLDSGMETGNGQFSHEAVILVNNRPRRGRLWFNPCKGMKLPLRDFAPEVHKNHRDACESLRTYGMHPM